MELESDDESEEEQDEDIDEDEESDDAGTQAGEAEGVQKGDGEEYVGGECLWGPRLLRVFPTATILLYIFILLCYVFAVFSQTRRISKYFGNVPYRCIFHFQVCALKTLYV